MLLASGTTPPLCSALRKARRGCPAHARRRGRGEARGARGSPNTTGPMAPSVEVEATLPRSAMARTTRRRKTARKYVERGVDAPEPIKRTTLVRRRPRPSKPQPLATTALVRRRPRPPKPRPPTLNLRELVEADRDPAAKYDRLPRLPGLEPRNTDPSGEGYASGYGRRRKKIFYDVPEAQLGELSVVSSSLDAFSGSLALREKPSASDYEKLPGAPSFGAVELFSAALDDEKPDRNGPTTPVKQRLFEPDLPPYSPQYVPKPSPVSDDESVARRAFPFSPPHTRKLHVKPRPKTWSGVRVRVFGDMAARELLTGAFRAEDRRSKSAPSAWKAVKKRVHGDMAARELLMGAYRTDADEIEDWRDPAEATFQQTPGAEAMSLSVRKSQLRRDVVPRTAAARWRGGSTPSTRRDNLTHRLISAQVAGRHVASQWGGALRPHAGQS